MHKQLFSKVKERKKLKLIVLEDYVLLSYENKSNEGHSNIQLLSLHNR